MAALIGTLRFAGFTTGITLKTVCQVRTSSHCRVRILEIAIGFHGTVNTNEPIQVDLYRQSSSGTMTAVTARPSDEDLTETFETTGGVNASAEPTPGVFAHNFPPVHPQAGMIYIFPKGAEIIVKPSSWLGLVVTAAQAVNCDGYIKFEE